MLVRFTSRVNLSDISRLTQRCESVGVQYKLIQEMGTSYLAIESIDKSKIDELYYQFKNLPIVEAIVLISSVSGPLDGVGPVKFKCGSKRIGKDCAPAIIAGSPYLESQNQAVALAGELALMGVHIYKAGPYRATSTLPPKALYERTGTIVREINKRSGLPATGTVEILGPKTALDLLEPCAFHVPGKFMFETVLREQLAKFAIPVFLERHPDASTELWLEAAASIVTGGNSDVALVETGRFFGRRMEIDLVNIAQLVDTCPLPVIVHASRAARTAGEVMHIGRAALASGVAGVMLDVHPNPLEGLLTDGYCLNLEEFGEIIQSFRPLLV